MKVFDLFDGNTRPKAPKIPGVTPAQREAGKTLAMIHDMHIAALDETMQKMAQVEAGEAEIEDLGFQIASMELRNNYRVFGNLCGRECQFLNFHHTSEETEIFPILEARGSDGLKRVIARLSAEHVVIHELLEELARNVEDMRNQPGPQAFAAAKDTLRLIYAAVRSHFSYEQTELEEALGFYNIRF